MMRLGTCLECVGSSPRVLGVCQDGAREFAGRRPRLTRRLSGVAERLTGSWEAYRGYPEFAGRRPRLAGRLSGVAERLAESWKGIRKSARNTQGDYRRRTMRLIAGNTRGCWIAGVRSLSLVVIYGCNP
ncbi:hypothetical protein BHM03_00010213 [Ensete ventricosum]|nr:hypothetical protein BHM03_00010213 [Ensete ventricosum]